MSETQEVARPAGMWWAFDRNAKQIDKKTGDFMPRIHELGGKQYRLWLSQATYMPEAHARVLLKDEAFEVFNEKGERQLPLRLAAQEREVPKRLDPDMVIASVTELTVEAMVTRAAQFPGGDKFSSDTERRLLERFLTQAQRAKDILNTASEDAPDGRFVPAEERTDLDRAGRDPDLMSGAELDKIMPKAGVDALAGAFR